MDGRKRVLVVLPRKRFHHMRFALVPRKWIQHG
jgi:hypothetical protein